ncbi:hypothetical protein AVEN_21733-1 [Araneus ventricosus]|uniref:ATP-dependent DNA helicase n=1 Tax=Araneus ventricosus TaxID=182803 RepID=A0A4Y2EUF3_ARAVE|nr:hypothetical protein AVEN_21733-1 [Araneus ventricosus]
MSREILQELSYDSDLLLNFVAQREPLSHNEMPVYNIKKGNAKAKVLQEAKVLFWDEISIMHKHGLEGVKRTHQDLRGNKDLMGGLIVVLADDFRQTISVIREVRWPMKSKPV